MTVPLLIIVGAILLSAIVGIAAGRRVKMDLENWTVAGRRLGVVLIWLLMAGEVYTTFTFLGASGWAYSRGAPVYYILIYGALAYTLSFFILPPLWRAGKAHGLHTQPDFFVQTYGSGALGVLVAAIGIVCIVPYLQLQLTGMGLIVQVASGGALSSRAGIVAGFVATCAFVLTSGLRGSAWVAVIKDVLMIAAVAAVGFGVPFIHFGGVGRMFKALAASDAPHLVFPGATPSMGTAWVMTTAVLTGCGFFMWPHMFGSAFSAKSERVIRRNAVIMPFYQVPILLVIMIGLAATVVLPGLKNGDLAFLSLVAKTYPPWFLGFVGAAGAVTAMVPASVLLLFAATLLSKNIYRTAIRPGASEASVIRVSRVFVFVIAALALVFAIWLPNALVNLLLIGYDGVSQFFPGVVLGLFWPRVRRSGIVAGLVAGEIVAGALVFSKHDPVWGMNAGFVALAVNGLLAVAVSAWPRRRVA